VATSAPRIALIAALAENRAIGRANRLPWHLPADLARFKRLTLDKPIIMGRRTWESLPGLLPRRVHIVVSRDPDYGAPGCRLAASPEAALDLAQGLVERATADAGAGEEVPEVMVIGGEALYRALLPKADRLYLTLVATTIADGDAFFPAWDPADWRERERLTRPRDEANPFDLTFLTLDRVLLGESATGT